MNWRLWVYQMLQNVMVSEGHPATSVLAGGALVGSPSSTPFLVYRIQPTVPVVKDGGRPIRTVTSLEVWAYDDPGSYDRVDHLLDVCRQEMTGPVSEEGAIAVEWISNGSELFDDQMKVLTRVGSYSLIGVAA